ncbi:unnamed protein product [Aureobasidium mustum]|uniref:Uncharacterized protein n=1 Tax=Aureobasidium mustum TaxID=2773714 RepID=A0A9N8K1D6_9PEZI|nr:unnamed protein product [Aureobasidium mustum]
MKPSTSILALSSLASLATATINVTYHPTVGESVHPGAEVRVLWDQDKLMDLSLQLVKKDEKFPLGFSWIRSDWMKLRLGPGHAEYVFWDVPRVDPKGEYAFYIEGFDVDSEYGFHMIDNGTSEWFSVAKWTPPKHEDSKV